MLLDFGSARQSVGNSNTLTILVAPGYAPFEQYYRDSASQGPWTDIYGLGATCYRAIAGRSPLDAVSRSKGILGSTQDVLVSATMIGAGPVFGPRAGRDRSRARVQRKGPPPIRRRVASRSCSAKRRRASRAFVPTASAPQPAASAAASPTPPSAARRARCLLLFPARVGAGRAPRRGVRLSPVCDARRDRRRGYVIAQCGREARTKVGDLENANPAEGARSATSAARGEAELAAKKSAERRERGAAGAGQQEKRAGARARPSATRHPGRGNDARAAGREAPREHGRAHAHPQRGRRPASTPVPVGTNPTSNPCRSRPAAAPKQAAPAAEMKATPIPAVADAETSAPPVPALPMRRKVYRRQRLRRRESRRPSARASPRATLIRSPRSSRPPTPAIVQAQARLGDLYGEGKGVPRDLPAAERWYEKAALQGDIGAQLKLGAMYANAGGAPRNNNLAYVWYGTALRMGSGAAKAERDRLGALLQPAEREQADKLIESKVARMPKTP